MSIARAALVFILVASPLRAQCADGSPPPCARRAAAPPATSIAVLSFQARDTADAVLAEGLADDIADRLGQVGRLVVRSREAVRRLPNAASMSLPDLGRQLNAAFLLTSSIQSAGNRFRVRVELTRAQSQDVVWNRSFEQARADILDIQAEIAMAVAQAVAGRLQSGDAHALRAAPANPEAFTHLTRGTVFLARRDLARAVSEFRSAVRLDSSSAVAWARLSYATWLCVGVYASTCAIDTTGMRQHAPEAAARALGLDSSIADGWLALGGLRAAIDMPGARRALERAVRLDPRNVEAEHQLAYVLARLGDFDAAEHAYRAALDVDPGRAITWVHLAYLAGVRGQYRVQEALCDTSLAAQPRSEALVAKWQAVVRQGDTTRLKGLSARLGIADSTYSLFEDAMVLVTRGDTAGALPVLARLRAAGVADAETAWLFVRAGRRDEADAVMRAAGRPSRNAWYFLRSPWYDPLHGIPGFDDYFERARRRAFQTAAN